MRKRTNVQAFVFTSNPSFKVLILKRTPDRSGYWQPVCGGVESGEELTKAVIREVFEETGISNIKSILDLEYTFKYKETKNGELMEMQDFCFAVEVNSVLDIEISDEHDECKWCSYDEAKEYLKWEHNLFALEKLKDIKEKTMNVLVLGGTRFFGVHMVNSLLSKGHNVTIATRGKATDMFGDKVERIIIERTNPDSLYEAFSKKYFDVVCDNLAYCSNDVKYLLDSLNCGRYIMTSSASVYENQHLITNEREFDPHLHSLKWCTRQDYPYDEIKRQAECALIKAYPKLSSVSVRFPYVIGEDDYTHRLYFYVEQIIKGNTMSIDNLDEQIGFISSAEAGNFLSWIAEQKFVGAINGSNIGTISLHEIVNYVEQKTGKRAIYSREGLEGKYNGQKSFSLDVSMAANLGYNFTELKVLIYDLLDKYIDKAIN